ncbi:MAG TPA: Ig-like domain-containing protein, partial [Planctomycetota bacterium]|nr:Ig-like domain-containing protein [Planctomycetota bacterium]
MTYTNSQDWTGGGIGNISADPLFVDADGADNIIGTYDDDYRMQANSPSIDAGDNAKVPAGVITDLAGNRRFDDDPNVTNTGSGTGSIVDQGAYERVFRPLAVNDAASTHQGNNVQLSVFDNDVTLNGGTLSITGVTQGTSGTVTIQGTKVTYSPNAGFVGSDSFTYTISTGEESPDTGTVTITVTNTAPQNTDQTVSTHWGTAKSITLAGSDADNDVITFAVVAQPQHGTLSGTAPNLTYTPMGTFTGADSFTYKVNDGAADSNVATITINVTNTAPQNADQTVSTHWGTAKSITLAGSDAESDVITFAVVAQPQHGTLSGTAPDLTYTPTGTFTGADSFTYKVNDGVADSNVATIIIDVANTVPLATDQTVSTHWGTAKTVRLTGGDADNDALTFTIVAQPQHGTLSGTAPDLTYTPTGTFTGSDSFTFTVNDGVADSLPATVTINVTNNAPTVLSAASPTSATPLEPITFTSLGTDADGDTLTYLWDFGDGGTSTDPNATHAYAAVGSYTAMVTVSDAAGGTASATVLVQVSKAPTGRVTTSDVVAFGNLPFTFDASTSTDPENAIVSYVWNFGDGSPNGSGQVISKIYEQPGTYTVTLTITDAAGVSTTISRVVEVLPANQAGLFNGFINYKVGWDRTADNKDNFSLNASVNVGDDVVGKDTTLAVEVAGQRFTGKLDQKLRDFTNADAKWTVKANVRKQPAGTVVVTLKVKKASLGLGFNQLGVTAHGDPSDIVEKDIPVRLEIGTRSFEVLV